MSTAPEFNHTNPQTVFDILWSWSSGYMTTQQAIESMELEDEMELYEACLASDVPFPGTPNAHDVKMAESFVEAVALSP